MKTVILHIGQSKTGTTSLQRFLYQHPEWLRNQGYRYLQTGIRYPAVPAQYGLLRDHMEGQAAAALSPEAIAARDEVWTAALEEIEATPVQTVLISCESGWLRSERDVDYLRKRLSAYRVQILLVLRKPSSYIVSSYKQHLKVGSFDGSFIEFVDKRRNLLDYRAMMDRWSHAFGRDNLKVLSFEAIRDDLVPTCLRTVGLEISGETRVTKTDPANVTPSDGVLYALRRIRALERILPWQPWRRVMHKLRRWILADPPSIPGRLLGLLPVHLVTESDRAYAAQLIGEQLYNPFDLGPDVPNASNRQAATQAFSAERVVP